MDVQCREFEQKYEVELKIDNKQQKVKLEAEFLPESQLAKNKVKLTIRSDRGRQVTANVNLLLDSIGFVGVGLFRILDCVNVARFTVTVLGKSDHAPIRSVNGICPQPPKHQQQKKTRRNF